MAIQLSEDFAISSSVYANQGNSDIGIRGSGKTHTATKTAEDLMSDNIPIVVFDPSGVWHNLRYGKGDQPGFPIVVAGGAKPDLELTELNAIKILEAAMKENVSIIFDLSEVESKAKEIKIVADCIEYIMQFNKTLRHIFIEEAAEYCPQKLNPGLFKVYSQLERMARIGRNKGLGFTLINQRSQEIAKAIFELCDRVFVHRQTGMNSLNVIDSWFKYKGIEDKNNIVKTLPKLIPGQCWVIDIDGEHLIQVAAKKTFHPDPQKGIMVAPTKSKTDVSHFIIKMSEIINSMEEAKKPVAERSLTHATLADNLRAENIELRNDIKMLNAKIYHTEAYARDLESRLSKIGEIANHRERIENKMPDIKFNGNLQDVIKVFEVKKTTSEGIPSGAMKMLKVAATFYPKAINKKTVVLYSGISPKSSNVPNFISILKRDGLIITEGNMITVSKAGMESIDVIPKIPTGKEAVEFWYNFIGPGKATANIFQYLAEEYPESRSKADIINAVGITEKSSSFQSAISDLKSYHLVTGGNGLFKAADELFI